MPFLFEENAKHARFLDLPHFTNITQETSVFATFDGEICNDSDNLPSFTPPTSQSASNHVSLENISLISKKGTTPLLSSK